MDFDWHPRKSIKRVLQFKMAMNRYGLSVGLLIVLLLSFSITAIILESRAYGADMKWRQTMAKELKILTEGNSSGFNQQQLTNSKPNTCQEITKTFGRFSQTHLIFLTFHSILVGITIVYMPYLAFNKNAPGKHIILTGVLYIALGFSAIVSTIAYQSLGVLHNDQKIKCDPDKLPHTSPQLIKYYKKLKVFRNFCHFAHLRTVNISSYRYVTVDSKNYTEREARQLGYCQEFGPRLVASLVGYWAGLMCIIIPCIAACCQPPEGKRPSASEKTETGGVGKKASMFRQHHDILTDTSLTLFGVKDTESHG